jgi:hypothetical protein
MAGSAGAGYQQIAQAGFGALFTHQFKSRSKRAAKAAYQARIAALGAAKGVLQASKTASTGYLNTGYDTARTDVGAGFDKAVEAQQPFYKSGLSGLAMLETLLTNPDSVTNTAAFQWVRDQGLRTLGQQQGAMGKRLSGQALKEGLQYSEGLAGQQYQNIFANAVSVAGIGERAAGNISNLESGRGTTLGQLEQSRGTALAANEYNYGQDLANIELGYGGVAGQLSTDKMNIEQQFTDYRFRTLEGATGGGSDGAANYGAVFGK